MNNHLDRIYSLGYQIEISWNNSMKIYTDDYLIDMSINQSYYTLDVLYCFYYNEYDVYKFEDMIEVCCDIFYDWYNKNLNKIKEFDKPSDIRDLEKLQDCCPGDVKKQVARELKLDKLLKIFNKS